VIKHSELVIRVVEIYRREHVLLMTRLHSSNDTIQ